MFIFRFTGEPVHIKVKPYNSFIVEYVCLGTDSPSTVLSEAHRDDFSAYVTSHHIGQRDFDLLLSGSFAERPHLPLQSQAYRGRVARLERSEGSPLADKLAIEADLGDRSKTFFADRDCFYVYGTWMGRADLAYLIENGKMKKGLGVQYFHGPFLQTRSASSSVMEAPSRCAGLAPPRTGLCTTAPPPPPA